MAVEGLDPRMFVEVGRFKIGQTVSCWFKGGGLWSGNAEVQYKSQERGVLDFLSRCLTGGGD